METLDLRQQYVKSRRGLLEVLEAQRAGGMISDQTYRRLRGRYAVAPGATAANAAPSSACW